MLRSASPGAQSGVSLTELMIGVALVALLMALALPSFSVSMQNRQIRNAAEAIQNGVQAAKTEALKRNRIVKFDLRDGNSWTVGCKTADENVVDGEKLCPGTIQVREASEGSAGASVAFAQLVAGTGAPAGAAVFAGDLEFTPLGRTTPDTLPAGNIAVFNVSHATGGSCASSGGELRCLSVRVSATGQIRMCDPALAAGSDPRAC